MTPPLLSQVGRSLRAPLSHALGLLPTLEREATEAQREPLSLTRAALHHLQARIEDLLLLVPPTPPTSARRWTSLLQHLRRATWEARHALGPVEITGPTVELWIDRPLLDHALRNLFACAAAAAPQGSLRIGILDEEAQVSLTLDVSPAASSPRGAARCWGPSHDPVVTLAVAQIAVQQLGGTLEGVSPRLRLILPKLRRTVRLLLIEPLALRQVLIRNGAATLGWRIQDVASLDQARDRLTSADAIVLSAGAWPQADAPALRELARLAHPRPLIGLEPVPRALRPLLHRTLPEAVGPGDLEQILSARADRA